jgi:NADH-ubiquinone oxidoreductase chain 1
VNYTQFIIPILEVLGLMLPVLFTVAYVTVAERKTMASMQRRLGPNVVGFFGLLQAFADALKLLLKEYVAPSQANIILFFLGPILTLVFSLLAFSVIPYGPGITLFNFNLGILYILAVSSISTYGILLAGWSANSKYAFLGSIRSSAQLISYELIITSVILLVIPFTGSLNLLVNVENQRVIWFILPLFPLFVIFLIASIAETNRAPFDLAEAESELVSGFMTEHSAVIFVFFFLAEYASIILMCVLITILFLGGYLYNYDSIINFLYINYSFNILTYGDYVPDWSNNIPNMLDSNIKILLESLYYAFNLGLKSCLIIFAFIWIRASFPRIRYDQLMSYCWTGLLPILVGLLILIPCLIYGLSNMFIVGYLL